VLPQSNDGYLSLGAKLTTATPMIPEWVASELKLKINVGRKSNGRRTHNGRQTQLADVEDPPPKSAPRAIAGGLKAAARENGTTLNRPRPSSLWLASAVAATLR
jgi:hypothetical protein